MTAAELLNLEIEIANEIIKLEKQITPLGRLADRSARNDAWFTREVYKAERRAFKQIADGIAWRYLGFNRSVLRKLADHQNTGFLNPGFVKEVEEAKAITLTKTGYVLLNDITNYLRHGDLTVIKPGEVSFAEIKTSNVKSSSKIKQRNKLDALISQLNQNRYNVGNDVGEVFLVPGKVLNFLPQVQNVIKQAQKSEQGFYATKLSPYLWVKVIDATKVAEYKNKYGKNPALQKPPFRRSKLIAPISSITLFDTFSPNVAPFTVFPFSEEIIVDIILARLWVFADVGERELTKSFKGKGWNFVVPSDKIWDERVKINDLPGRREATNNPKYFPQFVQGEYTNRMPWTTPYRVSSEFLSVKSIVNMLDFGKSQVGQRATAGFIADFELESEQWV